MGNVRGAYRASVNEFKSNPVFILPILVAFGAGYVAGKIMVQDYCLAVPANNGLRLVCDPGALGVFSVILAFVSVLMTCWQASMIAEAIAAGSTSILTSAVIAVRRLVPFALSLIFVGIVLFVEFLIGSAVSTGVGWPAILATTLVMPASFIFLMFAPIAAIYNELGPLKAMADSIRVVRYRFGLIISLVLMTALYAVLTRALVSTLQLTGLGALGFLGLTDSLFGMLVWTAFTRIYAEIAWERYAGAINIPVAGQPAATMATLETGKSLPDDIEASPAGTSAAA